MLFLRTIPKRNAALLACCVAVLVAAAACGSSGTPAPGESTGSATATHSETSITWVIERRALDSLYAEGVSADELSTIFNNSNTYIVGSPGATDKVLSISRWSSHRTVTTTNLRVSGVSGDVSAMLYDDEHWSLTPAAQQQDPAKYLAQGRQLAQSKGLVYIAAPASDLVDVLAPADSGTVDERYLRLDIIAEAARYADIVDIQAQGLEANTTQYVQFVTQAAAQARKANPGVKVLAGVSTNPSGHAISAQTFATDANDVRGVVDGFWLNIPSGGTACPKCGTAQPQVAVPWLGQLAG
jgi:hypothetical protein